APAGTASRASPAHDGASLVSHAPAQYAGRQPGGTAEARAGTLPKTRRGPGGGMESLAAVSPGRHARIRPDESPAGDVTASRTPGPGTKTRAMAGIAGFATPADVFGLSTLF